MFSFTLVPVLGVTQGLLTNAGFNWEARTYGRVGESIFIAITYASVLGTVVFLGLFVFPREIVSLFLSRN